MGTRTNLVDTRDRLGSNSMHAVAMSQNEALAKFLCKHSATCLDVPDSSGMSVRQMISCPIPMSNKVVMSVLTRHAAKVAEYRCENCAKQEGKLLECSRC